MNYSGETVAETVSKSYSAREREIEILALLAKKKTINRQEVQDALGLSLVTAVRDLRKLLFAGKIQMDLIPQDISPNLTSVEWGHSSIRGCSGGLIRLVAEDSRGGMAWTNAV